MARILVIDDEEHIAQLVAFNLKKQGYEVAQFHEGKGAVEKVKAYHPDLIVLDVMLPGMDGFEICQVLRKHDIFIPIIMLTAKDDEIDKILGLEMGADDYLTKPFSPRELVARVKAVLRRTQMKEQETSKDTEQQILTGSLVIYPERYTVLVDEEMISLTTKEFELLLFLARNQGKVLSRNLLLDHLWGYDFYGDTRVVDVHISHLRDKVEKDPKNPEYIKTVRGIGYKFREEI